MDAKSHRAASYPPGLVHLFAAGHGLAALTGKGAWGEATGSGGDGASVCCVPRGQHVSLLVLLGVRRQSIPTYGFERLIPPTCKCFL